MYRRVASDTCTQTDLDAWHAEKYATRSPAQVFLCWCMDGHRMLRLIISSRPTTNLATLSDVLRELGIPVDGGRTSAIR